MPGLGIDNNVLEQERIELYRLIESDGIGTEFIVEQSQKLDEIIVRCTMDMMAGKAKMGGVA